mmetsp:Transcript_57015/g.146742  ORF Transcript_57015/g.146742 Transcript_57015/m.146742 type:complete len:217 (-) Transcript_57015:787-1437(-)
MTSSTVTICFSTASNSARRRARSAMTSCRPAISAIASSVVSGMGRPSRVRSWSRRSCISSISQSSMPSATMRSMSSLVRATISVRISLMRSRVAWSSLGGAATAGGGTATATEAGAGAAAAAHTAGEGASTLSTTSELNFGGPTAAIFSLTASGSPFSTNPRTAFSALSISSLSSSTVSFISQMGSLLVMIFGPGNSFAVLMFLICTPSSITPSSL